MDLKEIDINTRNCIDSDQDGDYWRTLVNVALNLGVLQAMKIRGLWIKLMQLFFSSHINDDTTK
jgi:hypothetical protein